MTGLWPLLCQSGFWRKVGLAFAGAFALVCRRWLCAAWVWRKFSITQGGGQWQWHEEQ